MFCAAFAGVGGWIDTGGPCAATAVAASAVSMLLNNHRDIVHSPVGLVKNQPAASRGAGPPASARLRGEGGRPAVGVRSRRIIRTAASGSPIRAARFRKGAKLQGSSVSE